uniref:WKF domain-containing protein n=1 Tax=Anopheles epiroticus TaxID=199890 RepID=A0A182PDN5_9DIPT
MGKKDKIKKVPAETETVSIAEPAEKPKKAVKQKKAMKEEEEEEQIFTFQKPTGKSDGIKLKKKKAIKRSAQPEPQEEDNAESERAVPSKVSKTDKSNLIMAGTTIDQVADINLKSKKRNKRQEHEARVQEKQQKVDKKVRKEMRQYLQTWNDNRDQWKFNKRRQIFIQDNAFVVENIDDEVWPIALAYLSGTKGSSRDVLLKKAKTIIREGDSAASGNGDETLQASSKYERARELLQNLG